MANGYVDETVINGEVVKCTVYPTGDKTLDRDSIEYAIDKVADGKTVVLKRNPKGANPTTVTEFNFGGDDEDNTIYVTKNVTIQGDDNPTPDWSDPQGWTAGVEDNGGTTIMGGRVPFQVGLDPVATELKPVNVNIKNIRFKGFYREAIRTFANSGQSEISGCSFVDYEKSATGTPAGAFPIIVDTKNQVTASDPAKLKGQLKITHNFFGPPLLTPPHVGINNLVHVNDANLDLLEISYNRIEDMNFTAFAVWGVAGHTHITNNNITRKSSFANWPGAGISFGVRPPTYGRRWDGSVTIEKNRVILESPGGSSQGSYGIAVFRFEEGQGTYAPHDGWTDRDVIVRDNVINIEGVEQIAALACLGACSDSIWTGNVVSGCAQHGILVSKEIPFTQGPGLTTVGPTNNTFAQNRFAGGTLVDPTDQQEKDFEKFTAFGAQVYIASGVSQFVLKENTFGPVSGSNESDWPPPLNEPCAAGIACFGSDGLITANDFSTSDIEGWRGTSPDSPGPGSPPQPQGGGTPPVVRVHVGCIYLDEQTCCNHVEYCKAEFPDHTVPPPERQILDVAESRWATPGVTKPAGSENILTEVKGAVSSEAA